MNKESIFNLLFSGRGKYLDVDTDQKSYTWDNFTDFQKVLVADLQNCVDYINDSFPNAPQIVVGFIENGSIGASVNKYESTYYIAMYTGTYTVLQSMFSRMLTSPKVFTNYGNSSNEEVCKLYNPHVKNTDELHLLEIIHPDPKDPIRGTLSLFLTVLAMQYLVLHENGHILNGHVDFKSKLTGALEWIDSFTNPLSSKSINPLHSQVLEYDADAFANNESLRYVMQKFYGHAPERDSVWKFYRDDNYINKVIPNKFEQILILHSFACLSLYRLFSDLEVNNEKLASSSHSPPGIRTLQFITHTIGKMTNHINGRPDTDTYTDNHISEAHVRDVIVQATREVNTAFVEISDRDDVNEIGESSFRFALKQKDHLITLQYKWNEVRPLIEPYAYIPLQPIWQ